MGLELDTAVFEPDCTTGVLGDADVGRKRSAVARTAMNTDGPTVDPLRFRSADGDFPGQWRESPEPWVLDGLPERQRLVVVLREVEGRTSEKVCAMLEISVANQRLLDALWTRRRS